MNRWVRLIKLHGSFDWRTDPLTGDVQVIDNNQLVTDSLVEQVMGASIGTPGIIFGAGNKLRPRGPYLDLYSECRSALFDSGVKRLIVIGYGFGDDHVNELLRRWVARPYPEGRLLRLSTYPTAAVPLVVSQWFQFAPNVELQVVPGRACDTMGQLMAPTPGLLM
jgi:hypothetical protein